MQVIPTFEYLKQNDNTWEVTIQQKHSLIRMIKSKLLLFATVLINKLHFKTEHTISVQIVYKQDAEKNHYL